MDVCLRISEEEARELYRHLHRAVDGQEVCCETYLQLQGHFFRTMTVEEVTELLEGSS